MSRLRVSRREHRVERIEISPSVPLLNVLRADLAVRKGRMVDLDIDFTSKVYYLLRVCYSFHGDQLNIMDGYMGLNATKILILYFMSRETQSFSKNIAIRMFPFVMRTCCHAL